MAKQVKMVVSISGENFNYAPQDIVEWPDEIADAMLADGRAVPVDAPKVHIAPIEDGGATVDTTVDNSSVAVDNGTSDSSGSQVTPAG